MKNVGGRGWESNQPRHRLRRNYLEISAAIANLCSDISPIRVILGLFDILVDIGVPAEKEVIQ
jgi:hypothetical protein